MCYKAILPTAIIPSNSDGDLVQLTFSFNRWLKMLKSYGKLDESSLESDFSLISRVLRNYGFKKKLIRAVQRCRDLALARDLKISSLVSALVIALNILSKLQTNREIKRVERQRANQGMTERYRPLSRRLASEKIRKIDKRLCFTDLMADDKETTKLVRRFVEKRAAQIVYKNQGKRQRCSNLFRQSVRRATSFSLYNKQFAEYDFQQRSAPGTHWRVKKNRKGQKKWWLNVAIHPLKPQLWLAEN